MPEYPDPNCPVDLYAESVRSGQEMAGPLVRLACERHRQDRMHGHERGLSWRWVDENGEASRGTGKYVADFFEHMLLLAEDKPFVLAPPLLFIVGSLYGWMGPDGFRRYRVSYVELGKGNAKSTLAGGLGLYMLIADGEFRAECYAAACDKDQAKIPFKDAVSFINLNSELDGILKRSGAPGSEWNLAYLPKAAFFRPISSESKGRGKSGFRPHFVLLDEIHEHPTSAMVDLAIANLKTRTQPLVFMITNSGVVDPGSVCYQWHEHAERMLQGVDANNDAEFFFVAGLDKGDSWCDPAVRKKANPMYDVIPGMRRYLDEAVAAAKGMPSKISLMRRLNFCEWVQSLDPWVTKEIWDENAGTVNEADLAGLACFGGLDLSKRDDLTAFVLLFPRDDGKKDVLVFAWTPAEGVFEREHRDKAPYQGWIDQGILQTTPGKIIDYAFVASKIGELTQRFDIQAVAFDHWHFSEMERALNAAGVNIAVMDHPQGFTGMNASIEFAEEDLRHGRIRHGGNPLLTSCVFNVKVVKNAEALRMFEKKVATTRIDAAQSFVMACGLCATTEIPSYAVTWI